MDEPKNSIRWSVFETMSREELESLQLRRLKNLLRYLEQKGVFYKSKLSSLGLSSESIRSLGDMAKLPFTTKQDIVTSAENPLAHGHGELFCGDGKDILRWHKTSGTTGKPVRIPDTIEDWNKYAELSAEALYGMGIRKDDVVVVAFGYGPFIAFWTYIAGLERIGSTFIPSGNLDTRGRIELIQEFDATVFLSTPSYAIHLGETAQSLGITLSRDSRIRLIVHTGEPTTKLMKRKIEELWGATQMERIGSTETGGFAFECPHVRGLYHIQEGFLIPEIIDPESGNKLGPGETGELVLTPLYRRGMPLIRFRTGNVVKTSEKTTCVCGRQYLSLEETEKGIVIRRLDKLLKLRGVLVDPIAIENIVRAFELFGEEYRIILEKKENMDEIKVVVELKEAVNPAEVEKERKVLAENIKRTMGLRAGVEFVSFGKLERFQEKAKRMIDLR